MFQHLDKTNAMDRAVLSAMSHMAYSDDGKIVIAYYKKQLKLLDASTRIAREQNLYNLQGATQTLAKVISQFEKSLDILKGNP